MTKRSQAFILSLSLVAVCGIVCYAATTAQLLKDKYFVSSSSLVATAGKIPVADGTAYAEVSMSGDSTIASGGAVTVGKLNGVTAPGSVTSGGVPYYSGAAAMGSSGLLANHSLMVGGGAGGAPKTLGTLSGLIMGNGAFSDPTALATGANGQYLGVSLGSPTWQTIQVPGYNYIIDGGMEVNQRSTTGSFSANLGTTALTTDKYSIDRWKVATGVADAQCQRTDTLAATESGLSARYYETFKKVTSAGKIVAYQIIEANNAFPINQTGVNITIQCKLKASLTSANKKLRLGLIYFTGTADALPASLISAQGLVSVDPTLTGANLFYQTPLSIPGGAQGAITGNALDCTTTTSWQSFAFTTVGFGGSKNLIVAVWSDDTMAAADTFSMSEVGLYQGQTLSNYLPQSYQQELARVQRCCYAIANQNVLNSRICFGVTNTTSHIYSYIAFPVKMRAAPVLSFLGTAGNITGATVSGASVIACTGTPAAINPDANGSVLDFVNAGATWAAANSPCQVYWSTATAGADVIIFDADL